MSRLLQITDELRDLHAELSRLESVVASHPSSFALAIDLKSISKRQRKLEKEFDELTQNLEVDVVRYRLVPESSSTGVPLRALTKALDKFQASVATIYDALKSGPKQRAKLTAEIYAASGFDFGYTYAGSLGVVLTVPNERMLLDNSDLDYAITAFFEAADAETREQIVEFARKFGVPSVRRLYEWSTAHADFDMAADINFTRGTSSRTRLQVAPRSLRKLKLIIEETSETTDQTHTYIGQLVGLDTDKRSFHLVVLGGEDIEGIWSDSFVYTSSQLLDQTYKATLTKRVKVHYALEKEDSSWLLSSLEIETDL